MATEVFAIKGTLDLDSKPYEQGLNKASQKTGAFSKLMKSAQTGSFALLGGLTAAAGGAALFGVKSVQAFQESQNVLTQTKAVLKSTGGVAGVTANQVSKLAKAFQSTTVFSDEQVQSGENLLLTFTKISKDIFPEATETMLNMSQALGQDTKSSAIQLGKALQDPILGVTALRRVGVNFNKTDQETIKRLVETGQAAKAQAMILKELKTEFGGSAKAAGTTFAGSMTRLRNTFNDFQELVGQAIVERLAPLVDKFNEWLASMGGPEGLLKRITALLGQLAPHLPIIAGAIAGGLVPPLAALAAGIIATMAPLIPFIAAGALLGLGLQKLIQHFGGLQNTINAFMDFIKTVKTGFLLFASAFRTYVLPAVKDLWKTIKTQLWPALRDLWVLIKPILIPVLKVLAVVAGALVIGALVVFVRHLKFVAQFLTLVIKYIKFTINWYKSLYTNIKNLAGSIYNAIVGPFRDAFNWIKSQMSSVSNSLSKLNPFSKHSPSLVQMVEKGTLRISDLYGTMFKDIGDLTKGFEGRLSPAAISNVGDTVNNRSVTTNISGPINIGSEVQADNFLQRLSRNTELAQMGLTINNGK